ncbi:MAG: DUF892 family protein [Erythrobacter sp.]|nr:MAG: DUF892 family protein [Erythrobacter sp.]
MAEVETPRALLVMAVQDLHDGECAMVARLGRVRDCLDDEVMRELVRDDAALAQAQRDELAAIASSLDAEPQDEPNVWLRAILDDADNDCQTIAHGPLRDIALAGALRKGKQSQRVSYETALALSRKLDLGEAADRLSRMVERAEATDGALATALDRLSAGL